MTLGDKIKAKRKRERLSAEDLALRLGLKKDNIYKWEKGATPSDPEEYKVIIDWLKEVEHIPKKMEEPKPTQTAVVIGIEDLRVLQEMISEILIATRQNQKLLQQLNDEDDNEVDVPLLSNKKLDTRNYNPDKSGGGGNKRT